MISTNRRLMGAALLAATLGFSANAVVAQESTNRVATKTDWSVFTENSPKECWGVSSPKNTVNSRDGAVVEVQRGDILLFVTFRPGAGANGEVSFTGGYPFASNSTVEVAINGKTYQMSTDGEWAWPADSGADRTILAAMKAGSEAVLTARSGRGTQTKDTFSLMGFTAAMTEAENRCK
ncbi:invasion associated locus B family protein [Falsirhodobacter sp. alg1]|uniref:invasion associated locus B family protein n=1 Tax=Falsirhodobacter sp. alg1 TaxID=1472418 RepID=UPI0005EECA6D|nr:invasion associated locus B family protein [Falsirhodobacter sp. alg1]